jgi:type II secretory pathway component PulF
LSIKAVLFVSAVSVDGERVLVDREELESVAEEALALTSELTSLDSLIELYSALDTIIQSYQHKYDRTKLPQVSLNNIHLYIEFRANIRKLLSTLMIYPKWILVMALDGTNSKFKKRKKKLNAE